MYFRSKCVGLCGGFNIERTVDFLAKGIRLKEGEGHLLALKPFGILFPKLLLCFSYTQQYDYHIIVGVQVKCEL